MSKKITKVDFLNTLRAQRAQWEALVTYFDTHDMLITGPDDGWSIKDIIAHITWYEREMVGMLRSRALVGSELWNLPLDDRNAQIHAEVGSLALNTVLDEADMIFADLLNEIEQLSENDLHDASAFEGLAAYDTPPWEVIASNTYLHYQQHIPELLSRVKLDE
jgi:hypothetical protein